MGEPGQVHEEAMDEILASIRRMIVEEDQPGAGPRPVQARVVETNRPAGNVAKLFADEDDGLEPLDETSDNAVALAIAQAMEDAEAQVRADATAAAALPGEPERAPPAAPTPPNENAAAAPMLPPTAHTPADLSRAASREPPAAPSQRLAPPEERRGAQPLLSPRSDAVVSGAFNQLATTMLSGSARTIDDLVEDLLRPMLRSWLDANLPPLVERLVREEIERVSRGRR